MPLKQIETVLAQAEVKLPDALRFQRARLEEKQRLFARAIDAIRAAQQSLEAGNPASPAILKKIIEVIDM